MKNCCKYGGMIAGKLWSATYEYHRPGEDRSPNSFENKGVIREGKFFELLFNSLTYFEFRPNYLLLAGFPTRLLLKFISVLKAPRE